MTAPLTHANVSSVSFWSLVELEFDAGTSFTFSVTEAAEGNEYWLAVSLGITYKQKYRSGESDW